MTNSTHKFNIRNSVHECIQSLRKESPGQFYNYGIKDDIAYIASTKLQPLSSLYAIRNMAIKLHSY